MGKPAEASQPHPDSVEEARRRLNALLPVVRPPTQRDTPDRVGESQPGSPAEGDDDAQVPSARSGRGLRPTDGPPAAPGLQNVTAVQDRSAVQVVEDAPVSGTDDDSAPAYSLPYSGAPYIPYSAPIGSSSSSRDIAQPAPDVARATALPSSAEVGYKVAPAHARHLHPSLALRATDRDQSGTRASHRSVACCCA